jgi:flagellar M-ring protein FliF
LTQSGGDSSLAAGGQAFDQKNQIESSFENRITQLLTPVVGLGKIMARVTADVDFTRVESTDETIDPTKSAVVQESRTNSKKSEAAGAEGAAGAAATAGGNNSNANEGSEQINYQISKTVRHQTTPSGSVKKLSIAILVDGTYVEKDKKQIYTPRPAEELKKLEDLVKNAVGFSADRGDQMKIENMAFQTPEAQIAASETWNQKRTTYGFLVTVIGNVLLVAAVMMVFFFVIRPLVNGWLGARQGVLAGEGGVPLLEGEVATDVGQLVRTNPSAAADAIRRWLE